MNGNDVISCRLLFFFHFFAFSVLKSRLAAASLMMYTSSGCKKQRRAKLDLKEFFADWFVVFLFCSLPLRWRYHRRRCREEIAGKKQNQSGKTTTRMLKKKWIDIEEMFRVGSI
jgi:hypothetical protein